MSGAYGSESTWLYASAGATAALAIPIAVLGLIVCFKGRKRADPARTGFIWLKATFALYSLSFVLSIVNSAAQGYYYETDYIDYSQADWGSISNGTGRASGFFHWFADLALLISFVEIGNGFMYALTQTRTRTQKILRHVTFALMIPLVVMTFVNTVYGGILWSRGSSLAMDKLRELNYMSIAMTVLLFIYSVLAMIYASIVRFKYRGIRPSGKTVTLYLVATILTAVPRNSWDMVYSFLVTFDGYYIYYDTDVPTRVILSHLVILITLILLFVVSIRKQAGLWTTLQPWMDGVPPSLGTDGQGVYYHYPDQAQTTADYAQSQEQYYGWQPQQPQEVPGVPPNVVPAADYAHMLQANGPELRWPNQVHYELKA